MELLQKIQFCNQSQPDRGLREMLINWLKQVGMNKELDHKTPSLSALSRALGRDSVGENVLAERIKNLQLQNEGWQ